MFRGLLFYIGAISSDALGSPELLSSHSMIALHITTILITTLKHFNFNPLINKSIYPDVEPAQFRLYQEAETKHCRVAMLAFLGLFFGEVVKSDTITGPAIWQFQQVCFCVTKAMVL